MCERGRCVQAVRECWRAAAPTHDAAHQVSQRRQSVARGNGLAQRFHTVALAACKTRQSRRQCRTRRRDVLPLCMDFWLRDVRRGEGPEACLYRNNGGRLYRTQFVRLRHRLRWRAVRVSWRKIIGFAAAMDAAPVPVMAKRASAGGRRGPSQVRRSALRLSVQHALKLFALG